jgi:hypothetical protein
MKNPKMRKGMSEVMILRAIEPLLATAPAG